VTPSATVRDLGIHLDSVTKTVSTRFAVLRQLRFIRRSVCRPVVQSLVTSLVLSRLDYGNATLAGIPQHLLRRLLSVMYAAARPIYWSSRFDYITPLLRQLHWLKARLIPDWFEHRLIPSAKSSLPVVRRTHLTSVDDRSFPVAASSVWNNLPQHVITSPFLTMTSYPVSNKTSLSRKPCILDTKLVWNAIWKSWSLFQNLSC